MTADAAPTVVVADDSALFRHGLVLLLQAAGVPVLGEAADSSGVLDLVARCAPEVAIVDIRMPPTHTDEGIEVAARIRAEYPATGVLLLSTYAEPQFAISLLDAGATRAAAAGHPHGGRVGYLLKDRVDDVHALIEALRRIAAGGTAVDEEVVALLLQARHGRVDGLTPREREVLAMLAEGRSNVGIGRRLFLSPKTVERYIATVFHKLGLDEDTDDNRRVLATLRYLRAG